MEATNYLPPSKMARFSAPGILALPSTGLGLGLGLGPSEKSAFTFLQLQELEHQALIFKYMVAGVPVPFHLVLPIWKSVVNSTAGAYKNQPAWLGHGNLCFDYRNSIEPEPGRCRRTDGKKWRCSKDVVPDQKYCERHMHRGRHRSRKHVDGNNSAANNPNSDKNLTKTATDSSTHLSISIPVGLQLMTNNSTTSTSTNTNTTQRSGFSPTSVLLQQTPCKAESCL